MNISKVLAEIPFNALGHGGQGDGDSTVVPFEAPAVSKKDPDPLRGQEGDDDTTVVTTMTVRLSFCCC